MDLKVRTTFKVSKTDSGSERVKSSFVSVFVCLIATFVYRCKGHFAFIFIFPRTLLIQVCRLKNLNSLTYVAVILLILEFVIELNMNSLRGRK